jgi:hypothetical protein
MKRKLLMTAAVVALMAGMSGASAQTSGGEQQQPRMQNSPPGATAPKGEETVKPGIHEREPGAAVQQDQKEKGKMSQGQNEAQPRREGQTPMDQNGPRGGDREKMGQQGQGQIQGQGQMEQKERTTQQGTQQKQNTAGQGSQGSAKSVQLSSEQRTKIHVTLANQRAERITNANFTIRVGARVPRTVRFYPLPVEIVEIVPEYQGYDYVLVGDEILIIDPETLEIVAVMPA